MLPWTSQWGLTVASTTPIWFRIAFSDKHWALNLSLVKWGSEHEFDTWWTSTTLGKKVRCLWANPQRPVYCCIHSSRRILSEVSHLSPKSATCTLEQLIYVFVFFIVHFLAPVTYNLEITLLLIWNVRGERSSSRIQLIVATEVKLWWNSLCLSFLKMVLWNYYNIKEPPEMLVLKNPTKHNKND